MADIKTLLVILLLSYYSKYTIELLINKKQREDIKEANTKLNLLREKPIKTLKEQKEFINIKYPKRPVSDKKWYQKMSFKGTLILFLHIVGFVFAMQVWKRLFTILDIHFNIWQMLLIAILFPILFNYVMGKFNLNKNNDLGVFFR